MHHVRRGGNRTRELTDGVVRQNLGVGDDEEIVGYVCECPAQPIFRTLHGLQVSEPDHDGFNVPSCVFAFRGNLKYY